MLQYPCPILCRLKSKLSLTCVVHIHSYEHYGRALRNKGLRVVPVEGDGNCLFRSVSHQVYGDDSHHRLVRARCMDYMEVRAQEL